VVEKGDRVSFQLRHVFLPEPRDVLSSLTEEIDVEGTIVGFSDSGTSPRAFAVVELGGTKSVVVLIERLRMVKTCDPRSEREQRGRE
jgi:hypothetical protein